MFGNIRLVQKFFVAWTVTHPDYSGSLVTSFFLIQFLHVYAQEYEGGGEATWRKLFGFLMGCLYLGELVFITYMGIKEAPIHSALAFVPLAVTVIVHVYLVRNVMASLQNLSLDVAANVDIEDGELGPSIKDSLYAQPCLKDQPEERAPLPYRRDLPPETSGEKI